MVTQQREIERKFSAGPGLSALPDLRGARGVAAIGDPSEMDLAATYYDTADVRLAAHHITLRRRTGGQDAGWHLKLPVGGDERTEVRLPLDRGARQVPEELVREIRAVVRGRDLIPVAIVRTRRVERHLLDAGGRDLAVIADDSVRAERLAAEGHPARRLSWREVEVELADGDQALLDEVTTRLEAAGLTRSASASKLSQVLGDLVPPTAGQHALDECSRASDVIMTYLSSQLDALESSDVAVRRNQPDSVHKMRVATRRLRSALTTCRPMLDTGRIDAILDELKWLGSVLGSARDAEVLHARLRVLTAAQPASLVLGPVPRRIDTELAAVSDAARGQLLATLDDQRYILLLEDLDNIVADASFAGAARQPAPQVLPPLVAKAARRVYRAARAADAAASEDDRDLLLHDVRKAAKNARYAAELIVPVRGKPAARLAGRMEEVQETLGENQDSVVARQKLLQIAVTADQAGESSFTFGLMHGLERARAADAQRAYRHALKAASKKRARAWLAGPWP